MSTAIKAPAATAQRIAQYLEQQRQLQGAIGQLQQAIQLTVNTLAETQDVPADWKFDIERMEFVPPAPEPEPDAAADAQEARDA